MARKIPRAVWLVLPLAYFLYFHQLAAVGLIGPDEPRYASIARTMSSTGDWITPRLSGEPWFEKPALLYWIQGAAFRAGLGLEMAPRLPVALMAVGFLIFFWWILNREFGCRPAWFATLILGTSVAWAVCSQVGVPDMPLSVTYATAMLLALPWVRTRDRRWLPWVAVFLGLAVLAKGPVALALAAPILIPWAKASPAQSSGWRDALEWLRPRVVLPFLAVALPWYALCTQRNGLAFLREFFWKHNVERFTSADALQHGQPFWFYLPIVLAALLPWTPLLPLAARRGFYRDPRRRFLLAWVALVLGLFSVAANKLPGYILPLTPAAAVLLALGLEEARDASRWLLVCALLLIAFPIAAPMLPVAVAGGLTRASLPQFRWYWLLPLLLGGLVWMLDRRGRRLASVLAIAAGVTAGIVSMKYLAAPGLNLTASARSVWQQISAQEASICIDGVTRALPYGLSYYSGAALPVCADHSKPQWLHQSPGQAPYLAPAPLPETR